MEALGAIPRQGLEWLREAGLTEDELRSLNPCVPGEFTLFDTYYVNSGSPGVVYTSTGEGTLPMVAGRWFIIPQDVANAHPTLTRDTVSVARAVRLVG